MCYVTQGQRNVVERALKKLMKDGYPFTGMDVWNVIPADQQAHSSTVMPSQAAYSDNVCIINAHQTSTYVRELFNRGEMPGWASTQVIPKKGPVLYFKIHHSSIAAREIKRIRGKIEDAFLARQAEKVMNDPDDPVAPLSEVNIAG